MRIQVGNRLSKIYTRTGDDGTTGLAQGVRVDKDSPRIEAIGAVDELNSAIGLLLATEHLAESLREPLGVIQHRLFDVGGVLALPNHDMGFTAVHVVELESFLDRMNQELPPLKDFIVPGGCGVAAQAHMARSICRRAERRLISLHRAEPLPTVCIQYINRLSDLLFVFARHSNKLNGQLDVLWKPAGEPTNT